MSLTIDPQPSTGISATMVAPRVLLVDPNVASWKSAADALRAAGIGLTCVDTSEQALEIASVWLPTFVLISGQIMEDSNRDLCHQLRTLPGLATSPIVVIGVDPQDSAAAHILEVEGTTLSPLGTGWEYFPQHIHRSALIQRLRETLHTTERRAQALLEAFPDLLFVLNPQGVVIEQLGRYQSSIDGRPLMLVGKTIGETVPTGAAASISSHVQAVLASGVMQTCEYASNGHFFETRLTRRADGTILAVVRDITDRKLSGRRIWRLAFLDQLTGLPNRTRFSALLQQAVDGAASGAEGPALLVVNLDRFRRINDSFGHRLGDTLLLRAARRLKRTLAARQDHGDATAVVSRLGGDEFAILLLNLPPASVDEAAQQVRRALSLPYALSDNQLVITPSIGVALYPRDGFTADALLRSANVAMNRAKTEGRNTICWYNERLWEKTVSDLRLETELRAAIDQDALSLVYQPQVNLATGAIVGVEALLRWHHPTKGEVSPSTFIPVAEETGLIVEIGDWVIKRSFEQLAGWHARGYTLDMAINVSSEQIRFGNFPEKVMAAAAAACVRPQHLLLEITESLLMRDVDESMAVLRALRDLGLRIAIDDFGTGHSSLSYLKDLPLDALKIDRSFVQALTKSSSRAICAAIVAMARELSLKVIAEGVETLEQLEHLRRIGCDDIQGFIFSPPVSPHELEALLDQQLEPAAHVRGPLVRAATVR